MQVTLSSISGNSAGVWSNPVKELDKDAFLRLLVAQLKNQNPFEPMQSTEFLSQLAQFRSLEQLQNLEKIIADLADMTAANQACSMLGKRVEGRTSTGEERSGIVQSLRRENGKILFILEDGELEMSGITRIYA